MPPEFMKLSIVNIGVLYTLRLFWLDADRILFGTIFLQMTVEFFKNSEN